MNFSPRGSDCSGKPASTKAAAPVAWERLEEANQAAVGLRGLGGGLRA